MAQFKDLLVASDARVVGTLYSKDAKMVYGTCNTAAATAAKEVVTVEDPGWTLKVGAIVTVKFTYTNTASNPTLNVNGTGARSVFYNNAVITTSSLTRAGYADRYISYLYDGTNFVYIGASWDTDSTYTQASLGQGYGTCDTAAATVAKAVTLSGYSLATGGIVSVKFTYDVPASATLNVNSKGAKAIYYKGAAITVGVIKAGDVATFIYSTYYHLITIDRSSEKSITNITRDGTTFTATYNDGTTSTFTQQDNNTTYTFATGDANGQIKVTPSGGSAQNVDVKGLAALAYKASLSASDVGAIASSLKGANNGVAELGSDGKVPSSQLPAYVDDVLEYANVSSFPSTGETGKIYVAKDTNKTYRWSGSKYVEISASLALGETSSTAYRGDRGKIAYDHSQSTHARTDATKTEASSTNGKIKINGTDTTVYTHPSYTAQSAAAKKVGLDATGHVVLGDSLTKSDVGLGNVGNFLAVSTVANQGLTEEQQQAARDNIGAGQAGLTLGTGSNNAYYGDRGETAYTHAIVYATCDTAKGTAAKVATIVGDVPFALVTGRVVVVSFTNGNEYNGTATLKVGTAEAKNIYYNGTTANSRYMWAAGENVAFIYDGTQYRMLDGGLGSSTYYGAVKLKTSAVDSSTSLALTPSSLNALSQNMIAGAPVYSSSSTYAVGDRVRASYQTWQCTTAITTAESWNADHWEALPAIQTQLDEGIGKVNTSIAAANQTYYLTGVTTTSATSKDQLYNTRLSNSFTGVKYQTSTSAQGGTLTVDEREVTLGLYYEIS